MPDIVYFSDIRCISNLKYLKCRSIVYLRNNVCIIRELQIAMAETQRLEKYLKASEDNAKTLSLRTISLESQLADREVELHRVEMEYHSQM